MEVVQIYTEFIRLDACLKFCAAVGTGGEAKALIQEGYVLVNGEVCTQRGKKIHSGDVITLGNENFEIVGGREYA